MLTLDRRSFCAASGTVFVAGLSPIGVAALEQGDVSFVSAFRTRGGAFGVAVQGQDGHVISKTALPQRGHDVVVSPAPLSEHSAPIAVVFARRPGTVALAFEPTSGKQIGLFSTPEKRHFYGHGAFSLDGKLLFATENDYERGQGVVGVYDATNGFDRLGEFGSGGVGPHEILMLNDGCSLAIANGGIETHPDFGRAKLNLMTMQPNLSFVDVDSGTLANVVPMPKQSCKVSIRHMVQDAKGVLWLAGQNEDAELRSMPLVWKWSENSGLSAVEVEERQTDAFGGYIGSIAYDRWRDVISVTSPKSHVRAEFSAQNPKAVRFVTQEKVCGVAASKYGFSYNSLGSFSQFADSTTITSESTSDLIWDNHLTAVMR